MCAYQSIVQFDDTTIGHIVETFRLDTGITVGLAYGKRPEGQLAEFGEAGFGALEPLDLETIIAR